MHTKGIYTLLTLANYIHTPHVHIDIHGESNRVMGSNHTYSITEISVKQTSDTTDSLTQGIARKRNSDQKHR